MTTAWSYQITLLLHPNYVFEFSRQISTVEHFCEIFTPVSQIIAEGGDRKIHFFLMHQSIPAAPIPPPPPGNCGAFACLVSPEGGALANLARPGGRAFAYPRAFDTHVVSDSKSKHGGIYCKGPAVRRRLDRLPRTGQTCGGFLDFMRFFIAHQGTTIT